MVHDIYWGVTGYNSPPPPPKKKKKKNEFLSLKIDFVLADSAYIGEMPLYAAISLGLHCLLKFPFFQQMVKSMTAAIGSG